VGNQGKREGLHNERRKPRRKPEEAGGSQEEARSWRIVNGLRE